jgi:hypothetical protein
MLDTANREIRQAAQAEERRLGQVRRLTALVSALDDLLFELELLNLRGSAIVPEECKNRAALLIAEALRLDTPPEAPRSVSALMDRVYTAQNTALVRRRRAGWDLGTPSGAPN